ncbi:hypothetical protein M758_UG268800 [Ceratodon purpureus]|nr:hypothetical protein M758_UG268800 [Ceratodon purpureus]
MSLTGNKRSASAMGESDCEPLPKILVVPSFNLRHINKPLLVEVKSKLSEELKDSDVFSACGKSVPKNDKEELELLEQFKSQHQAELLRLQKGNGSEEDYKACNVAFDEYIS